MKRKYNLTTWQRITLPLLWMYWKLSVIENKKTTWHEVVSGIEKHEHKFTIPYYEQGYRLLKCEHYGCTLCDPVDERLEVKVSDEVQKWMDRQKAKRESKL